MNLSLVTAVPIDDKGITVLPPISLLPPPFVTIGNARRRLPVALYLGAKRLLDILLVLSLLIFIWPFLLLVALLIRLDSSGPLFHLRKVLARQTLAASEPPRTFMAYKFRTMVPNADAILESDPALRQEYEKEYKLQRDPRVTHLGAHLRAFSLDEFPQLFNVLRGEMSLVGPRMISPPELARYGNHGATLLSVKPGLTGIWQVSGRHKLTYEDRVQLDVWYIEHRSFRMDLVILWRTIGCVFSRTGAF
jgi:lipopolysaccharide/colanic/teichoic acid biosynthesis glycosyltransferase